MNEPSKDTWRLPSQSPEAQATQRAETADRRLVDLERSAFRTRQRRVLEAYARFYPAVAVIMVLLTFVSLFDLPSYAHPSERAPFPSIWEEAGDSRGGAGVAILGLVLGAALVVLAVIATFRPELVGPPIMIAVLAVILMLMLLFPPGFGNQDVGRTQVGNAGIAYGIGALVLGVVHAIHANRRRHGE